jgi:membrane protein DedA with SNARE-associated domain
MIKIMELSMPTIPLHAWIEALGTFYDQYGYLIVFLGTFGENTALLGLVLPGNSLALLGAFYARAGTLNLGWVVFFAWLGTILGYHVDYLIGRYALAQIMARWGRTTLGRRLRLAGRIRLARKMLARHGGKAILFSHTIGHMRSFVALSAGITHMKYSQFLLFEAIAALFWNMLFSLLGYFIAMEIDRLEMIIGQAGGIIFVLIALAFIVWLWWRRKRSRALKQRRKISMLPSLLQRTPAGEAESSLRK